MPTEKTKSTEIQTFIFDKKVYSPGEAKKWLKEHGYRSPKMDETEDSLRFRQKNPSMFRARSFRTIRIAPGIQAVIGRPMGER